MTAIKKICRQNPDHHFIVTQSDLNFYQRMDVPPPTLCPDCRQQRRLAWRGERFFYSRSCDLCNKRLISIFAPDSRFTVYCRQCWLSDQWNPKSYAVDFDFTRPFFEQFYDLLRRVPLVFSYNIEGENSEYNNNVSYLRNCYLLSSSNKSEDCYYGYFINDSRNCIDCTSTKQSELCYECIECLQCYDCKYCHNCSNCSESWLLQNCLSCNNCFGCVNMRQKQYCFFNQQLSKEDYLRQIKQLNTSSHSELEKLLDSFRQHGLKFPFKYMIGEQNENVSGNTIFRSKNAHECYDCIDVEDCKFCSQMQESKNCYDVLTWGRPAELVYEALGTGNGAYMNRFTLISQTSSFNTYCYMCWASKHLFGCVSISRGAYCILNKQYTENEYQQLTKKIITHMKETGEWGEFFPIRYSTFAYNESLANDFHPITKEQATKLGASWVDTDPSKSPETPTISPPDTLKEGDDSILKQTFYCQTCTKAYKIIEPELRYYHQQKLPPPKDCSQCRHKRRIKRKNPRRLFDRSCACCNISLRTTYSPEQKEIIYCEKCYNESIYTFPT